MGSGGCQTLAGAISTGTHNSDRRAPLVDNVRAIHLVGPRGREWWIEPSAGLLAPGALLRMTGVCDDIRIVRDDDFFRAAMVSAGRFGVIYAVVLEVPAQYRLKETSKSDEWSLVSAGLRERAAFGDGGPPGNAHFNQYALDLGGRDKVWVTKRVVTTDPEDTDDPHPSPDMITDLCKAPGGLAPLVAALAGPFAELKLQVALVPVVGIAWSANIDVLHVKLVAAVAESKTIGDFLAAAVSELNDLTEEHVGFVAPELEVIIKALIEGIFDDEFEEDPIVGPSGKLLDTHNYDRDGSSARTRPSCSSTRRRRATSTSSTMSARPRRPTGFCPATRRCASREARRRCWRPSSGTGRSRSRSPPRAARPSATSTTGSSSGSTSSRTSTAGSRTGARSCG